jgi:hypothetical protein
MPKSAHPAKALGRADARRLADQLLIAEYGSIREEVHRALEYAQGIVKWSIAAFGVIFAAGLVALEAAVPAAPVPRGADALPIDFAGLCALVVFSAFLPGLITAAAWTWLGELLRMERAGAYLRGLEHQISLNPLMLSSLGSFPLRWETTLHTRSTQQDDPMRKQVIAYLGTAALFFGSILASLIFAVITLFEIGGSYPWISAAAIALAALILVVFVYFSFRSLWRIWALGRHREGFVGILAP